MTHNEDSRKIVSHIKSQHELHEGEEISLGIRPNHLNRPQLAENDHAESANAHNPNQTQPTHNQTANHRHFPKIDLHPRPNGHRESRVSPFRPEKKPAKIRESFKSIRSHKHWHNAKLIIGTILVFVLVFNSQWFISQFMYLLNGIKTNQSQQTSPQNPEQNPTTQQLPQAEIVGPQNEIIIPKIGVTAPLVFVSTNNELDVLKALRDGVVHYYGTALPGENGNSAFFGHSSNDWWEPGNYKFVFVLLEKLSVGDTYEIHYNSRKYVYRVTETKVVNTNDLSVLNQTTKPTSTLITCTPPGTSWRRFVVSAVQIEPTPVADTQKPVQQTSVQSEKLPSAPPSLWQQIKDFFLTLFGQDKGNSTTTQKQQTTVHLPDIN